MLNRHRRLARTRASNPRPLPIRTEGKGRRRCCCRTVRGDTAAASLARHRFLAHALARRLALHGAYLSAVPPASTLPPTFASASPNASSPSTPTLLPTTSTV